MDFEDFEQALDPKQWQDRGVTLNRATFQAHLQPDGVLFLRGAALREGFSLEATQALARFLSHWVTLPPPEPPLNENDFLPKRVE